MRRATRSAAPWRAPVACLAAVLALGAAGCGSGGTTGPVTGGETGTPALFTPSPGGTGAGASPPAHTVVVVMENHSYSGIIGSSQAPFINTLARSGLLLTNSHGVTHPSEPNYLALFSGSTQQVTDDSCPHRFTGPNLASELIAAGRSFAGYSEGLPATGSATCESGRYARKHVPWINFTNVPASASKPFRAFPSGDYARLPTVSFVIPDLCHDMHDCPVAVGDAWLASHLGGYVAWAMAHNSLLVLTWDENDGGGGNHIATIFVGQHVRPGRDGAPVTHYGVLRTIEALYRLPPVGEAGRAAPVRGLW